MKRNKNRVCPVEMAGSLDNRFRNWFQNPRRILGPYIQQGMTVMDFGCGPGFFTLEMARMVGKTGRVIAVDLQEGMLEKLNRKIYGTDLEERIHLHRCEDKRIGLQEKIDFVLAFYVIHEIPDQKVFFDEIKHLLQPEANILIAEPPFHVSKRGFDEMINIAANSGLKLLEGPKGLIGKVCVFKNTD